MSNLRLTRAFPWIVPSLVIAATVGTASLASAGNNSREPTRDVPGSARLAVPLDAEAGTESFPVEGAVLTPVANGTPSRIDAAAATAAAATDGIRFDVQSTIKPVVTLKNFTNTLLGQSGEPPFGPPKYLDVLVWDVKFPDAPVQVYGPIGRDASHDDEISPCDLHVIVDATTAAVIEGFQDCP